MAITTLRQGDSARIKVEVRGSDLNPVPLTDAVKVKALAFSQGAIISRFSDTVEEGHFTLEKSTEPGEEHVVILVCDRETTKDWPVGNVQCTVLADFPGDFPDGTESREFAQKSIANVLVGYGRNESL